MTPFVLPESPSQCDGVVPCQSCRKRGVGCHFSVKKPWLKKGAGAALSTAETAADAATTAAAVAAAITAASDSPPATVATTGKITSKNLASTDPAVPSGCKDVLSAPRGGERRVLGLSEKGGGVSAAGGDGGDGGGTSTGSAKSRKTAAKDAKPAVSTPLARACAGGVEMRQDSATVPGGARRLDRTSAAESAKDRAAAAGSGSGGVKGASGGGGGGEIGRGDGQGKTLLPMKQQTQSSGEARAPEEGGRHDAERVAAKSNRQATGRLPNAGGRVVARRARGRGGRRAGARGGRGGDGGRGAGTARQGVLPSGDARITGYGTGLADNAGHQRSMLAAGLTRAPSEREQGLLGVFLK